MAVWSACSDGDSMAYGAEQERMSIVPRPSPRLLYTKLHDRSQLDRSEI